MRHGQKKGAPTSRLLEPGEVDRDHCTFAPDVVTPAARSAELDRDVAGILKWLTKTACLCLCCF
jgi:hypothetical protein